MKIVLVNTNLMKPPVVPVGLDYLSTALKQNDYEVDLLDLCKAEDWKKSCDEYFLKNSPDAIGVTIRNTDDCFFVSKDFLLPKIKQIVNYIKTKCPAPIILGGVGFSIMPEKILEYMDVPLGIIGEGEESLLLLLNVLGKTGEYLKIPGLVCKVSGTYRRNPPKFLELFSTSLSARDTVDNPWYFNEGGMGAIETKRGCEKKCIYCADPVSKGRWYRLRPPGDVADEFENLLKNEITHFHLCDSEFNLPREHAIEICRELILRKLGEKIQWYTYASPLPFDEELAQLMKEAGCAGINFGADSANYTMLKNLGRDFIPSDLRYVATLCQKYKITFMFDLLFGAPGETRKTIRETIEFIKDLNPDRVGIAMGMRVYPGTPISEIIKREGLNDKLYGKPKPDTEFFLPTFYLEDDFSSCIENLIAGDERFFFPSANRKSYNYNDNKILIEAIKGGCRGAFWDILRQMKRTIPSKELEL